MLMTVDLGLVQQSSGIGNILFTMKHRHEVLNDLMSGVKHYSTEVSKMNQKHKHRHVQNAQIMFKEPTLLCVICTNQIQINFFCFPFYSLIPKTSVISWDM